MASYRQIRAARVLLEWTQQTLADRALVSVNTVRAIEANRAYPKDESLMAVQRALQKAGIVFQPNGTMGEGVRFARPVPLPRRR
ncbi:MAG TPA: helix-turn-helix transcriptional regulator [Rhizomicrobium sp.]|nr:helix-turn-helix transcriptional regulator [Rhizomicrobium sp.]